MRTIRTPLVALLFLLALMGASTSRASQINPYAALTLSRISDPEEWSTGVTFGAEITEDPVYVTIAYDAHDVLSDHDAFPWDSTFKLGLGIYKEGYDLLDIGLVPYGGLLLSRPSGPDEWSTGLRLAVEADFDPIWLDLGVDFEDILSDHEVYPFDTVFSLAAGVYFGGTGDDEDDDDADEDKVRAKENRGKDRD